MIKIEKLPDVVKVELPIKTLTFNRDQFDNISENIYFKRCLDKENRHLIREEGKIEDLNRGHWLSLSES
jgi:hypothetical protein